MYKLDEYDIKLFKEVSQYSQTFFNKDNIQYEDLIAIIEDLLGAIHEKEKEYNDLKEQLNEYYIKKNQCEINGISENDFI